MLFLRTLIRLAQSPYAAFAGASLFVMLIGLSPASAQAQTPPPVNCASRLDGSPSTTVASNITVGTRTFNAVTSVGKGSLAVATTCTLSDGSVNSATIADETVTGDDIKDETVTGDDIKDGTITEADLGLKVVTKDKIGDKAVDTEQIADNAVDTLQIADNAVTGTQIADKAVDTAQIADEAVDTLQIADEAVTTEKIADEAVTTNKIKNSAVTENKIAADAVTTDKIKDEAVTTNKIADLAVTEDKIATDAVTTDKIKDEAVTTNKIADEAVTTEKIKDLAVTTNKIADEAVTTEKIKDLAVTTNKIADEAVTTEKIKALAVVENKIANDAISTRTIQNLAVTTDKIANHAVTSEKIRNYSVNLEDLSQAAQHRLGTVDSLNRDLREDSQYLTTPDNPLLLDAEEGQVGVTLDLSLAPTDPDIQALKDQLEAIEQSFQRGTPLALIQIGDAPWSQGLSQQMQDQIKDRLNLTLWSRQEIGLRWDNTLASTYAAPGANLFLDKAIYENNNLREQTNYLGARIGLDPNEAPNPNGSLQAQVNYLNTQVTQLYAKYRRGTALAASLQDPYVPAGKTGSFSIATASYDDKTALSFGLASIVGTRGRLTLAAAFSDDNEESLYRLGYSLSW